MNRSRRRVLLVDSFTTRPFTGNPAGVVPEAEGLSDEQMQAVARELRASETAFVWPADGPDHDVRVRFFTPMVEVPSCGHATLAAHAVRASDSPEDRGVVVQKVGIGLQSVAFEKHAGGVRVSVLHDAIEFSEPLGPAVAGEVLDALGAADVHDPRCPVQVVSTGHSKVMVGVRSSEVLNRLRPDSARLAELSRQLGSNGFFVFTLNPDDEELSTDCRMFAPAIGIDEDPVTGNGHGPLGAYLIEHGLLDPERGTVSFQSRQGLAMARPGRVNVEVRADSGRAVSVRVEGEAVVVLRGELEL